MRVYQTRPDGVFIGFNEADPSPLEEGVWLLPAGCVTVEPPSFGEGSQARWDWDAERWVVEPAGVQPDPEPAEPTLEAYRAGVQLKVDRTAQERNYENGLSCASYTVSTNATWAAEAQNFVAWRDAVWTYAYAELAKVEAGERTQPTVTDFLAELPTIAWPQ
ncbi:hypothetical protein [Bosea minatitlanensis]|uniref:Phage tail protein n=1 Tax=Bosea minatitlanensis TaxID=128782 RepID=A0ABW0F0M2_9HYPH|nr:hypothetical protein [Bosea minatitlanensis]MCT4491684.1 hypothetical protein [Bosea minatitlanensis]